jgi:hypothetical protein
MGFVTPPAYPGEGNGLPDYRNFSVQLNNAELEYIVQSIKMEKYVPYVKDPDHDFIFSFDARMLHGMNVLEHTFSYKGIISAAQGICHYPYRLTTAQYWAGGRIGEFELHVRHPAHDERLRGTLPYCRLKGKEHSVHIEGSGRYCRNGDTLVFELDKGIFSFKVKNYNPDS